MPIKEARLHRITQDRVRAFGDAVGDHNPIHFDEDFARASGLPTTVVHGPLTVAVVLDAVVAQLGTDQLLNMDVRLRAPVHPGDELIVREAEYGVSVEKEDGTTVATAVLITQVGK
jgi:acyl dehydratase